MDKPKAEAARERVLTMDELARVWRAAGLLGYPAGPWARVLMLTGQRRSEVAGMRWADVDLEAGTWTLTASHTKAKRAHLVPLPAAALAIIRDLPRIGDYVFGTTANTPMRGFAREKRNSTHGWKARAKASPRLGASMIFADRLPRTWSGLAFPNWSSPGCSITQ